MCSVEIAGRTKMKRLWKYLRCRILHDTELKNVSAHSGCLWSMRSPMKCSFTRSHSASASSPAERRVRTERVTRLDHDGGLVRAIRFAAGPAEACDALFFTAGQHQKSDLAVRLGCAFNRRGTVDTGLLCQTNVPGLFVAGDASRDAQFVVVAAAEGVKAALAINQAMQRAELS